jgi:hypothetical protein
MVEARIEDSGGPNQPPTDPTDPGGGISPGHGGGKT